MKGGTMNLSGASLHIMERSPNEKANAIGREPPYYLQYIRSGKPNNKPKEAEQALKQTEE